MRIKSLFTKRNFKRLLLFLGITFIIIQFFHPDRNISSAEPTNHISKQFPVSSAIKNVLDKSCGDCHSNNTAYPWYFNIQPVAWWLANHIEEGKREVNFDEFASYSLRRQFRKFKEIKEQIEEGEMPLSSYTFMHKDALMSPEQKQSLIKWSVDMMNEMKAKYPIDSLVRKEQRS
jgi:hypothetical protein